MKLSTSSALSKSSSREFIFKLFVLEKNAAQRKAGKIVGNAASVEYRRVRFSSLADPGGDTISVQDFLLANNNARCPETTYLTSLTAANKSDCYQALLDRSKLYFASSSVNEKPKSYKTRLLYQDEDDDWVVLGSNEELRDAMMYVLKKNSYSLNVGVQSLRTFQEEKAQGDVSTRCTTSRYLLKDEEIFLSPSTRSISTKKLKVVLQVALATFMGFVCTRIVWMAIGKYFSVKEYSHRLVVDTAEFPDLESMLAQLSENENNGAGTHTSVPSSATRPKYVDHSKGCNPEVSLCYEGMSVQAIFSDILVEADIPPPHYLQKAYKWMAKDPRYQSYSKERLLQRLGLAAFFYATGGDTSWKRSDDWLSYSIHECSWFPGGHSISLCDKDWQYRSILLPDNGLNGSVPKEALSLLTSLTTIRLDRNIWLTGNLPSEIGELTRLEQLWLHHNMFSGSLPSELARLTRLEKLSLAANTFTGRLTPEAFGKLSSLRKLWLDHNEFTGKVPLELGNLPLMKLHISHNSFDGGGLLPSLLVSLTKLEDLVASVNVDGLDVVVPTEIGLMTKLRHLQLYVPEETWSSLSSHQWQRSEVATLHKLDTLRIASEESGAEPVDLVTW